MSDPGRRLIACCDGTNNTLTAGQKDTNVLRLYEYLERLGDPSHALFYDPGVGSPDSVPPTGLLDWAKRYAERIAGLASGQGIYANIAEAYLFLMRHWRGPQDRIYLFGFSRGAFTARAVAGMVNLFGLLRPEHEPLIPMLIHVYFSQPTGTGGRWTRAVGRLHAATARPDKAAAEVAGHTEAGVGAGRLLPGREALAQQIATLFVGPDRLAEVHWIGVWDTVESVGLPGPLSRSNPASATLAGKRMRHVRHALSLDEHRWAFEPRLYEEPGDMTGAQTLKQRWFPGVHCDAGGSYDPRESGISNRALEWMLDELADDLAIPRPPRATGRWVRHDPLYETAWWALAGMSLRNVAPRIAGGRRFHAIEDDLGSEAAGATSVWSHPRSWKTPLIALALGALALVLAGACAVGPHAAGAYDVSTAPAAALALARTLALGPPAFAAYAREGWQISPGAPGWALFWGLVAVACAGYLLARVASRAYAWLAGRRRANSKLPAWRIFGFAPLAAFGASVVAELLALASIGLQALGGTLIAYGLQWLAALACWVAVLGAAGCVPLGLIRLVVPFASRRY